MTDERILRARIRLRVGDTLAEAARCAGMPADELDRALWKSLGERPRGPARTVWHGRRPAKPPVDIIEREQRRRTLTGEP